MGFLKWLIGGTAGAAIGGLIWVAVGYFAGAEVGYIAWGIGLLAGIGVRVAADEEGMGTGIAAVAAAALCIVVSKYLVVTLLVNKELADMADDFKPTPEDMIAREADEVAEEFKAAGKKLRWPNGMNMLEATTQADYPTDVWAEATKRWNSVPADQQAERMAEVESGTREMTEFLAGAVKDNAFKSSFNFYDLLWFALAAFTAFRVGAGGES